MSESVCEEWDYVTKRLYHHPGSRLDGCLVELAALCVPHRAMSSRKPERSLLPVGAEPYLSKIESAL